MDMLRSICIELGVDVSDIGAEAKGSVHQSPVAACERMQLQCLVKTSECNQLFTVLRLFSR